MPKLDEFDEDDSDLEVIAGDFRKAVAIYVDWWNKFKPLPPVDPNVPTRARVGHRPPPNGGQSRWGRPNPNRRPHDDIYDTHSDK